MDPITQGALGASVGQAINKHPEKIIPVSLMAAVSGMAPDLDVIIRSSTDPLLFLEYHRQFTHSLFFIPFGALLCACLLHFLVGKKYSLNFRWTYLVCFAGYATHALLDACTTYGTLLLWPFSNERFAWNTIAVIDLAYTLPILLALFFGIRQRSVWPARVICLWILFYPALGYWQMLRAQELALKHIPPERADNIISLNAKPSMSNIVLWKIVYQTENHYFVDAIKIGLFWKPEQGVYFPGDSVKKLDLDEDFPWLEAGTQQAKDVERFSWFSNGFVAKDDGQFTNKKNRIMDVRYSIVPNEIHPLWSIGLNPEAEIWEHVEYENHRDTSVEARQRFFDMLFADPKKP